jgi:hypothetical protein
MAGSIEKLRDGQPDGINNKSNLKDWADIAKGNSYRADKAQLRHDIGTEGSYSDPKINEADTPPLKPFKEGRGWAKMDPVTKRNAYTGS